MMELSTAHSLQCELPICSVIEERTTFTCASQLAEGIESTFYHAEQLIWPYAF